MGYFSSLDDYNKRKKTDNEIMAKQNFNKGVDFFNNYSKQQDIKKNTPGKYTYEMPPNSDVNIPEVDQSTFKKKELPKFDFSNIGNFLKSAGARYNYNPEQQDVNNQSLLNRWTEQTRQSLKSNWEDNLVKATYNKIAGNEPTTYEKPNINYKTGLGGDISSELLGMTTDPVALAAMIASSGVGASIKGSSALAKSGKLTKFLAPLAGEGAVFGGIVGTGREAKDYVNNPDLLSVNNFGKSLANIGLEAGMGAGANVAFGTALKGAGEVTGRLGAPLFKKFNKLDNINFKSNEVPSGPQAPAPSNPYYAYGKKLDLGLPQPPEQFGLPKPTTQFGLPTPRPIREAPVNILPTGENPLTPGERIFKGNFTVNNDRAKMQAQQELEDAIITIQNHFGTNRLTPDEIARVKSELGIDIEQLIARVENPSIDVRAIGERAKFAQIGDINNVMARPDQTLYNLKYPRNLVANPRQLKPPSKFQDTGNLPMDSVPPESTTPPSVLDQFKKDIFKKKIPLDNVPPIGNVPPINNMPLIRPVVKPNKTSIPNIPVDNFQSSTGLNTANLEANRAKVDSIIKNMVRNKETGIPQNNIPSSFETNTPPSKFQESGNLPIEPNTPQVTPNAIPNPNTALPKNTQATTLTGANGADNISKYRTNTIERAKMFDDDIRTQLPEYDYAYEKGSEAKWTELAIDKLSKSNIDDEIIRLTSSKTFQGPEDVMMTSMIAESLKNKGKLNGDNYAELNDFLSLIAPKLRKSAQELKAQDFAWNKTTPEGAVLRAQNIFNKAEVKYAETNPKAYEKINDMAKDITLNLKKVDNEAFDIIAKEFDEMLKGGKFRDFKTEFGKESLNPKTYNHTDRKIDSLIRRVFTENGLNMGQVVREFNQKQTYRDILIHIKNLPELQPADKELLANHIKKRMEILTNNKKQQILDTMIKDPPPKKAKKTEWDKTLERIMVGAYDNNTIAKILKEKKGIPILDADDVKTIITHMEKSESIGNKNSREYRAEIFLAQKPLLKKLAATPDEKVRTLIKDMLLTTRTMSRNVWFNVGMGTAENLKDIPGSLIDRAIPKKYGNRTTGFPEYLIARKGNVSGAIRGTKNYIKDLKEGVNTSRSRGISEISQSSPWKDYRGDGGNKYLNYIKSVPKIYDTFINLGLKAGDDPFFEAAFEGRIQELMKLNKVKAPTDEMIESAFNIAKERININESNLVKFMSAKRKLLNKYTGGVMGNLQDPFVQAPYNALNTALDYSGVGVFKAINELLKAKKGQGFNRKRFVDTLARSITGAGIFGAGTIGTKKLTGDFEKNKEKRLFNESVKGEKEHQFKTPVGNIDYKELMPYAAPLSMAVEYNKNKSKADAVSSGVNLLASQSSLNNLRKLYTSSNTPGDIAKGLYAIAMGYPSMFIPAPIKKVNQSIFDRTNRETYDRDPAKLLTNTFKASIPGLSKNLQPKLNSYGKETKTLGNSPNSLTALFESFINPLTVRQGKDDNVTEMLDKLTSSKQLGDKDITNIYPDIVSDKITKTNKNKPSESIKLTPTQQNQYQKYVGEQTEAKYNALATSSAFKSMSDKKKVETLQALKEKINVDAKKKILREMGK